MITRPNFFVITAIACSLFSISQAQQIQPQRTTNVIINDIQTNMSRFNDKSEKSIKGSPYINQNFTPSKISHYKDSIFMVRYNAYSKEMEVLKSDTEIMILDSKLDHTVTLTNTKKVYKTVNLINEFNIPIKRFLVVLFESDNLGLYKEEQIRFHKKIEAKSSYSKEKPAKYERIKDKYYIRINDVVNDFPQKTKGVLKLFPDREKDIKQYIKDNSISLKKENDILKLVKYLSLDIN